MAKHERKRKAEYLWFTLIVGIIAASILAGCTPPDPVKQVVLDPKVVKTWPVDYWVASDAASTAISPDSKYMLLVQAGPEHSVVAAVPLAAEDSKEVQLYTVDKSYLETSALDFITVGWTSNTQCTFLASGWQAKGPNKGKRGVAVLTADVSKGSSEEIAFVQLEEGLVHNVRFIPSMNKIYLDLTRAIWTVDVATKSAQLVKDGLPTYDGMFMARMSPDASAYVYQLHETDAGHGIFTLDAVTGEQKPLAPNGDTMGFYPAWSPDSKYIAFYAVPRIEGKTGTTWVDYAIYPGVDGPFGIAPAITVMDRNGNVVRTIALEGKVLAGLKWSADSKSIAFVAGPKPVSTPDTSVDWQIPTFTWYSVWSVKSLEQAAPVKMCDLDSSMTGSEAEVMTIAFDPEGKGVFFQVSDQASVSAVWYASLGKTPLAPEEGKPVRIASGYWQYYPDLTVFGDSLAAIISGGPSEQSALWLLNSKEAKKACEWKANYTMIVAYNADMLVTSESAAEAESKMTVRSMFTEKVVGK